MGDGWRTAAALEGLAAVAVSQNRPRGGLRLGGAAAGLRVRLGTPLVAFERASLDQALSSARAALEVLSRPVDFPSCKLWIRPWHRLR